MQNERSNLVIVDKLYQSPYVGRKGHKKMCSYMREMHTSQYVHLCLFFLPKDEGGQQSKNKFIFPMFEIDLSP